MGVVAGVRPARQRCPVPLAFSVGARDPAAAQAYLASLARLTPFWGWISRPLASASGRVLCACCGLTSHSVVAMERRPCELVGRLPRDVRFALRSGA